MRNPAVKWAILDCLSNVSEYLVDVHVYVPILTNSLYRQDWSSDLNNLADRVRRINHCESTTRVKTLFTGPLLVKNWCPSQEALDYRIVISLSSESVCTLNVQTWCS